MTPRKTDRTLHARHRLFLVMESARRDADLQRRVHEIERQALRRAARR